MLQHGNKPLMFLNYLFVFLKNHPTIEVSFCREDVPKRGHDHDKGKKTPQETDKLGGAKWKPKGIELSKEGKKTRI
jgi:hypothetical protein